MSLLESSTTTDIDRPAQYLFHLNPIRSLNTPPISQQNYLLRPVQLFTHQQNNETVPNMPGSHKLVTVPASKMDSSPLPLPSRGTNFLDPNNKMTAVIFGTLTQALVQRTKRLGEETRRDVDELNRWVFVHRKLSSSPPPPHPHYSTMQKERNKRQIIRSEFFFFLPDQLTKYSGSTLENRLCDLLGLPRDAKAPERNGGAGSTTITPLELKHGGTLQSIAQTRLSIDLLVEAIGRNIREAEAIRWETLELSRLVFFSSFLFLFALSLFPGLAPNLPTLLPHVECYLVWAKERVLLLVQDGETRRGNG